MVDRLHFSRYTTIKRAFALLTALAVLAVAIGIPLPRFAAKDTSRPFPCMHHACGCQNADACWKGCCCMTHEQKLAWAAKHHVQPPENAVASSPDAAGAAAHASRGCCRPDGCQADARAQDKSSFRVRLVQLEDARKCQGLGSLWVVLSQALPPAEIDSFAAELLLVSLAPSADSAQTDCPSFDLATPPPRAAV